MRQDDERTERLSASDRAIRNRWTRAGSVFLNLNGPLGTGRVIVPVTLIGDQDGQWDRAAWKTEAFYGNLLTGFTAPR